MIHEDARAYTHNTNAGIISANPLHIFFDTFIQKYSRNSVFSGLEKKENTGNSKITINCFTKNKELYLIFPRIYTRAKVNSCGSHDCVVSFMYTQSRTDGN